MPKAQRSLEQWQKIADRRSSPPALRLRAGLYLLYQRATGACEGDPFPLNARTWSDFEQCALLEAASYSFFDRSQDITLTPNAALANAMRHLWTGAAPETPTTIDAITQLTNFLCSSYETRAIDRRARTRASLGLDVIG